MIAMSSRGPELTRQAILEAAFAEIHEHGFQAASLDRILSKTNVTKGALYHHFPSKHALGLAVVDEVISKEVMEWRVAALGGHEDPFEAIILAAQAEVASLTPSEMEQGCPLNNLIHEMSPLDEEFRLHLQAIVVRWQKAIAETLRRGQTTGRVRADVDCDAVAWFVLSIYAGVMGLSKVMEKQFLLAVGIGQVRAYFNGLRA